MSRTLYVGNLPFTATEELLREFFSQMGTVASVKIIKDENGRSKGFGFVDMTSETEASNAAKSLNGKELGGRALKVDIAQPREARPPRSSRY